MVNEVYLLDTKKVENILSGKSYDEQEIAIKFSISLVMEPMEKNTHMVQSTICRQ